MMIVDSIRIEHVYTLIDLINTCFPYIFTMNLERYRVHPGSQRRDDALTRMPGSGWSRETLDAQPVHAWKRERRQESLPRLPLGRSFRPHERCRDSTQALTRMAGGGCQARDSRRWKRESRWIRSATSSRPNAPTDPPSLRRRSRS